MQRPSITMIGLSLLTATVLASLSTAAVAVPKTEVGPAVRWMTHGSAFEALQEPDGRVVTLGSGDELFLSHPGTARRYPGLSALLDVSAEELERADVIAFEENGGNGAGVDRGWESSIWHFSDGVNSYTAYFDEEVGVSSDPSILRTGSVLDDDDTIWHGGDSYAAFFGMCSADEVDEVVSYILFDLDAVGSLVDVTSSSFTIVVEGDESAGEGTPDPDAIGVLRSACG